MYYDLRITGGERNPLRYKKQIASDLNETEQNMKYARKSHHPWTTAEHFVNCVKALIHEPVERERN